MQDLLSPRVNAARLSTFVGRTRESDNVVVEACDGGQVVIHMMEHQNRDLVGTFVEIIGQVVNESTIKFLMSLNLDSDKELDMKLVNDVVELTFDPRFAKMFPS